MGEFRERARVALLRDGKEAAGEISGCEMVSTAG